MDMNKEFWDFIETNVPNYYTREDVLHQGNLQIFIDHGDDTYIKKITREEAIKHRDNILFRLYEEAIDNFSIKTPEQQEFDEELYSIYNNDALCDRLGEFLIEETLTDTEVYRKVGRSVIEAYLAGNPDDMILAICGWTMKSLIEKTKQIVV